MRPKQTLVCVAAVVCISVAPRADAPVGGSRALVPYFPLEPAEPYVPNAMDETTRLWIRFSRRAALHGDLAGAIELMQIAANALVSRRNDDFELWDNLAELYCAQANRETDAKRAAALRANGRAMLAEFRCGTQVFSGSEFDMSCKTKRGVVPNSKFTPLCYELFCAEGERDYGDLSRRDDEGEEPMPNVYELYLSKFREDAANLPAIEQVCRVERAAR